MFVSSLLLYVLAAGVTGTVPVTRAADPQSQQIIQTITAGRDGTPRVDEHVVDANATTVTTADADGRVTHSSRGSRRRILIELVAHPKLDAQTPGLTGEVSSQQERLTRDLMALDARLHTATPSTITREYETLFSGVAATVDAKAVAEIRRLPNVAAVYEDSEMRALLSQSVPMIGGTAVAATYGVTGAGIKVAVIDSGIDYTHPDLGGCFGTGCKVAGGYDFVHDDADPRDDHGHGTHVAGIIAANGGTKGVAPGATLLAYKVLDNWGRGVKSDVIAALEQAVADGARIANLSLGGDGLADDPLSVAIDNATAAGLLSVAAAGEEPFPGYQNITSPGVAVTALTVGSTNKSWEMDGMSARGYVRAGDRVLMKPELVAPGVDIRSTVPRTVPTGDPSGYRLMSGTSMAAAHAAGAAALLLQWDGTQTPLELKNRLVSTARAVSGGIFVTGTGGLDLVAAFAARVAVSETHASFGLIEDSTGTVVREQTISLRNQGTVSNTLNLTVDHPLATGTTLQILPSAVTLQPGQSTNVTLRLTVDAAILPEPPQPLAFSAIVSITGTGQTLKLPVYVFKGVFLTLALEEEPWFAVMSSDSWNYGFSIDVPKTVSQVVKRGLWDVLVLYSEPDAIVVREQVNVQHSQTLNIRRTEATRTINVRAIDDTGQPLDESDASDELHTYLPRFRLTLGFENELRMSPVSERMSVAIVGSGYDPSRSKLFISSWAAKGLSMDVSLPAAGVPYRRVKQVLTHQPFSMLDPMMFIGVTGPTFGDGNRGVRRVAMPLSVYFQVTRTPDCGIWTVQGTSFGEASSFDEYLEGAYFRPGGGSDLHVSRQWYVGGNDAPEVLSAEVERWDLDAPPYSLSMDFINSSSEIRSSGARSDTGWASQTLGMIHRILGVAPTFDLYRDGVLVSTRGVKEPGFPGFPMTAGAYEMRASLSYPIGDTPASSNAAIAFDTRKSDPNPPYMSRFHIQQNGIRTPTPFFPATNFTPTVKFRVTDRALASVTLESRSNGSTDWTPVALTQNGSDYEAPLPQSGAVDLRLIATDATGNSFKEEWLPAIVTTASIPPDPPSSITATRALTAKAEGPKVSLSWPAAHSQIGISGYRIDRFPDNATFTTSGTGTTFDDTNGLIAGNAYLYSVSAIDTNDGVSAPSPQDLVALVHLQDDPIVPGVTPVRGAHVGELRRAIDAIRVAVGLPTAWTDYEAPTSVIQASDFVELRDRLNEARGSVNLSPVQFMNAITRGALIRGVDLEKLRAGIR